MQKTRCFEITDPEIVSHIQEHEEQKKKVVALLVAFEQEHNVRIVPVDAEGEPDEDHLDGTMDGVSRETVIDQLLYPGIDIDIYDDGSGSAHPDMDAQFDEILDQMPEFNIYSFVREHFSIPYSGTDPDEIIFAADVNKMGQEDADDDDDELADIQFEVDEDFPMFNLHYVEGRAFLEVLTPVMVEEMFDDVFSALVTTDDQEYFFQMMNTRDRLLEEITAWEPHDSLKPFDFWEMHWMLGKQAVQSRLEEKETASVGLTRFRSKKPIFN